MHTHILPSAMPNWTEKFGYGKFIHVLVQDNGVGMSKEKLEDLFELKAKRDSYGTAGERGLGLGLQMVKDFVDMNRGTIDVQSEEGKGSVFTVGLLKG